MNVLLPEDNHWWFASRTRALYALLDPVLGEGKFDPVSGRLRQVLDVGCGAGNMRHHLERYGRVTGFDSFTSPLKVAVERGCRVVQADAGKLPFPDGYFDLVAALDVVEHCPDDRKVLAEITRVVRPGGTVAVTVPAFQWLWSYNDDLNHHKRRYTRGQLQNRLEEAGLTLRRIGFNNFFIFPVAAAMIMAKGKAQPQKLSAPDVDGAYQVEMQPASPLVNTVLDIVGRVEASCIRQFDLPIGTSLLCVAERPR